MQSSVNSGAGSFPIERLRGRENFDVWKRQAKSCLVIKGIWNVVDKGVTNDKDAPNDERALAEITLMLDPSNYSHIAAAKNSKEAWDAIMKAYQDTGLTRKVDLLKQLVNIKLKDHETVQAYINDLVMTAIKLNTAGLKVDDEMVASLMLAGLPDDYKPMVMAVENSKKLTVDTVKNLLLQDAKFDSSSNDREKALYTNKNNKKPFKCHTCKGIGHFSKNCPNKEAKKKNQQQRINKNHYSNERTQKASDSVLFAKNESSEHDNNKYESSDVCAKVIERETKKNDESWYIDSGASCHMTNNKNNLHSIREIEHKSITVANNNKMSVKCAGETDLILFGENENKSATVQNVEYVPELCANLLSVRQMTKSGKKLVFENNYCNIYDKNKELMATAYVENDLYKLQCELKQQKALLAKESFELWHRRLGHVCNKSIEDVNKFASDIEIEKPKKAKCVTCIKAKQTRNKNKESGARATKLLEIVHSDVLGPLRQKSHSGAVYLVSFVDDYSRKVFVYPIKQKSEVFGKFMEFKNMCENQCASTIKILRTDNGREYINGNFESYLQNSGIVHQKTTPYTPEQNGVAERMNRTLMERVRCMLIDSGLDHSFWAEAAMTAAYIINRVPCRGNNICPEEIWSGKKPNLKFLRVFGCIAMVHIPKEKRHKLAAKSVECVMVGYSCESKAYRLYNPKQRDIIISRDVVFLENKSANLENLTNNLYFPNSIVAYEDVNSGEGNTCSVELTSDESPLDGPTEDDSTEDDSTEDDPTEDDSTEDDFEDTVEILSTSSDATIVEESVIEGTAGVSQPNDDPDFEIRRSTRIASKQAPSYNFCAMQFINNDPETFDEATASDIAQEWIAAMKIEIDSLSLNGTWIMTNLPAGKKAVKSKWVYKTKYDANGQPLRRKARLVAKGFSQIAGIDYAETFAPVVRYESIRFLLALAAKYDMQIHQMDAVCAYLNGSLSEEVYMEQPKGFDDGTGQVCKLLKSIYGLKQSGRVWNETLNNELLQMKLSRSEVDQCIYYNVTDEKMVIVAIYVDDIILFSSDISEIHRIKGKLSAKFEMKDMGEISSILGIRITRSEDRIKIDQSQYIASVLERFGMSECNPVATPIDCNQKLSADMSPRDEAERQRMIAVPYMQAIGCLLFAAQITRPDICYAVNALSRYAANPGKAHWEAVKRIMRYLKGSLAKGLTYVRNPCNTIIGYCDADWASDVDDRRSTTGYIFTFQSGAISWATKKQKTIALSSTEAEFMSMVAAIQESIWLKRLEKELIPQEVSTMKLFCDNKSAIQIAKNNAYSPRTKHVDIKAKFIRQQIDDREIELIYLPTNEMVADLFTKGVPNNKLLELAEKFGLA